MDNQYGQMSYMHWHYTVSFSERPNNKDGKVILHGHWARLLQCVQAASSPGILHGY